jgi:hypothetical protein
MRESHPNPFIKKRIRLPIRQEVQPHRAVSRLKNASLIRSRGIEMAKEVRVLATVVGAVVLILIVSTWVSNHRNAHARKSDAAPQGLPMPRLATQSPTAASSPQSTSAPANQPFYEPARPVLSRPSPPQPPVASPDHSSIPEISTTVDGEPSAGETEQGVAPQQETAAERVGRRLRHR